MTQKRLRIDSNRIKTKSVESNSNHLNSACCNPKYGPVDMILYVNTDIFRVHQSVFHQKCTKFQHILAKVIGEPVISQSDQCIRRESNDNDFITAPFHFHNIGQKPPSSSSFSKGMHPSPTSTIHQDVSCKQLQLRLCNVKSALISSMIDYMYTSQPYRCLVRLATALNKKSQSWTPPSTIPTHELMQLIELCQYFGIHCDFFSQIFDLAIQNDEINLQMLVNLFFVCMRIPSKVAQRKLTDRLTYHVVTKKMRRSEQQSFSPLYRLQEIADQRVYEHAMLAMSRYLQKLKQKAWPILCNSITMWLHQRSLSLIKLHQKSAKWHPHIRFNVNLGHKRDYIVATTVFQFNVYQFQIRLNLDPNDPIQWRILQIEDRSESLSFVFRGRVKVQFETAQCASAVAEIRYTNTQRNVRHDRWHSLWDNDESLMTHSWKEIEQFVCTKALLRVRVIGNVFVWANPLCNLYHFLLASTLFTASKQNEKALEATLSQLSFDTLESVLQSDNLRWESTSESDLAIWIATFAKRLTPSERLPLLGAIRWDFVDEKTHSHVMELFGDLDMRCVMEQSCDMERTHCLQKKRKNLIYKVRPTT